MNLRIERLTVDEGLRLRTIRLRALRDSPEAFGATFEEANARPEESMWVAPEFRRLGIGTALVCAMRP
jgi:hypothetical protein